MSRPELSQYSGEGEGKGRSYRHPFALRDGKPITVPSVTTILKLEAKDALMQWAVNLSVAWCVANVDRLMGMSVDRGVSMAKYRWRDVRDDRAQVGTGVHDTIEAEHVGSWDFPILDAEQKLIMDEWRKFNQEWEVEPQLSEFTVWSHKDDWAGTADGLWRLTNRLTGESFLCFIDLKTSNNVWDAHRMQLAALTHADKLMVKVDKSATKNKDGGWPKGSWVEEPMPEFDRVALLHLRAPRFDDYGRVTEPGKHDLIFVDHLDDWYEEFLGYRKVALAQEKRKTKQREDEVNSRGFA